MILKIQVLKQVLLAIIESVGALKDRRFFFFSPPAFLLAPWEARGEGWWKVGTREKGKAEGGSALTR